MMFVIGGLLWAGHMKVEVFRGKLIYQEGWPYTAVSWGWLPVPIKSQFDDNYYDIVYIQGFSIKDNYDPYRPGGFVVRPDNLLRDVIVWVIILASTTVSCELLARRRNKIPDSRNRESGAIQ